MYARASGWAYSNIVTSLWKCFVNQTGYWKYKNIYSITCEKWGYENINYFAVSSDFIIVIISNNYYYKCVCACIIIIIINIINIIIIYITGQI